MFTETHLAWEPDEIEWPELDDEILDVIHSIPFWAIARDTEREAGLLVTAFAETIKDPVISAAVALQGREETRHARLMEALLTRYNVSVAPPKPLEIPTRLTQRFITFGFEECLESYFAFGMFELVRESGRFPEELLAIFDRILYEEARHISFFINWYNFQAVRRRGLWGVAPVRAATAGWHYVGALRGLTGAVGSGNDDGFAFTATGASKLGLEFSPKRFLALCRRANSRRLGNLDSRLLRPSLVPNLAATAGGLLRFVPIR